MNGKIESFIKRIEANSAWEYFKQLRNYTITVIDYGEKSLINYST